MDDRPDIANFTRGELVEEYFKIFDDFQDLRECNEVDKQKIYELKRSLDTATAAQAYLSQELDLCNNSNSNEIEKQLHKSRADFGEMKKRYDELTSTFATLQLDNEALQKDNIKLTQNLEASLKQTTKEVVDTQITEDYLSHLQMLENENMELLQKIDKFEELSVRNTLTIAEYEKNVEILRDQITCLEENLKSKRADLKEKVQILESTQEQLAEANAKISMLSPTPDNNGMSPNNIELKQSLPNVIQY